MKKETIVDGLVALIRKAETELPKDVISALKHAYEIEEGIAKTQIETILKNVDLAKKSNRPMCQDTGIQKFFVKVGVNYPHINQLKDLINNAVKKATIDIPIPVPQISIPFSNSEAATARASAIPISG